MKAFLEKHSSDYKWETIATEKGYDIISVKNPHFKECLVLFTSGLSEIRQNVIAGSEAYAQIELYFCLPEYWNLKQVPWPLEYLKRIADYVVAKKSWVGNGHTFPAGNPPAFLEDHFKTNAFVIMRPEYLKHFFGDDFIAENGFVPLAVVPIFDQELQIKIRTSHILLFEKFIKKGVDERVDTFRKSVFRKKIFGIF